MQTDTMKTYILIHGAWQASWCWQKVAEELKKSGHKVITPDLPGHGDGLSAKSVSFNDYVTCVSEVVEQEQQPVVLVGHSMAGMIISQVAENIPEHIAELIYVTAYVPKNGDSLISMADHLESRNLSPYLIFNGEEQEITFKPNTPLRELFYQQCTNSDAAFAISKMQAQALEPFTAKVHLTNRYADVKKRAIICTNDQVILQNDQQRMSAEMNTTMLDADHAPFFSKSGKLAKLLERN